MAGFRHCRRTLDAPSKSDPRSNVTNFNSLNSYVLSLSRSVKFSAVSSMFWSQSTTHPQYTISSPKPSFKLSAIIALFKADDYSTPATHPTRPTTVLGHKALAFRLGNNNSAQPNPRDAQHNQRPMARSVLSAANNQPNVWRNEAIWLNCGLTRQSSKSLIPS